MKTWTLIGAVGTLLMVHFAPVFAQGWNDAAVFIHGRGFRPATGVPHQAAQSGAASVRGSLSGWQSSGFSKSGVEVLKTRGPESEAQLAKAVDASQVAVVEKSFHATGATPDKAVLNDYTVLNQKYSSMSSLATTGQRVMQELSLRQTKIVTRNSDGERLWEVYGYKDQHTLVTVVLSSFRATTQSPISVLTVSETLPKEDVPRLESDMFSLASLIENSGWAPQISTCMSGFVGARLGNVSAKTLVDIAFAAVHAKRVEGVSSSLVTSESGYTSSTPWHLVTAGGWMNVQVAVHYDDVAHKTRIVVGSPIIVTTY